MSYVQMNAVYLSAVFFFFFTMIQGEMFTQYQWEKCKFCFSHCCAFQVELGASLLLLDTGCKKAGCPSSNLQENKKRGEDG